MTDDTYTAAVCSKQAMIQGWERERRDVLRELKRLQSQPIRSKSDRMRLEALSARLSRVEEQLGLDTGEDEREPPISAVEEELRFGQQRLPT